MGESHVAVSFLKVASVTCHYYSLIIIGLCILPLFVMLLRRGGRGFPRSTFLPVFYLSYTVLGQNYFPYIVLPIPDVLRSWLVLFYVPRSHTLLFSVLSYSPTYIVWQVFLIPTWPLKEECLNVLRHSESYGARFHHRSHSNHSLFIHIQLNGGHLLSPGESICLYIYHKKRTSGSPIDGLSHCCYETVFIKPQGREGPQGVK